MLAVSTFMLVFRFLHIVAGVLWVGSTFVFVGFIGPSATEVGPSAGPLLIAAVKRRKVVKVITGLGVVNVLAGWILWLRNLDQAGSLDNWVSSRFGLVLTIGGVLATITFFVGYFGVGRRVERLVEVVERIAASGGPPSGDQQAEIDRISGGLETHGKIDLTLLLLATIAMATARFW